MHGIAERKMLVRRLGNTDEVHVEIMPGAFEIIIDGGHGKSLVFKERIQEFLILELGGSWLGAANSISARCAANSVS